MARWPLNPEAMTFDYQAGVQNSKHAPTNGSINTEWIEVKKESNLTNIKSNNINTNRIIIYAVYWQSWLRKKRLKKKIRKNQKT